MNICWDFSQHLKKFASASNFFLFQIKVEDLSHLSLRFKQNCKRNRFFRNSLSFLEFKLDRKQLISDSWKQVSCEFAWIPGEKCLCLIVINLIWRWFRQPTFWDTETVYIFAETCIWIIALSETERTELSVSDHSVYYDFSIQHWKLF